MEPCSRACDRAATPLPDQTNDDASVPFRRSGPRHSCLNLSPRDRRRAFSVLLVAHDPSSLVADRCAAAPGGRGATAGERTEEGSRGGAGRSVGGTCQARQQAAPRFIGTARFQRRSPRVGSRTQTALGVWCTRHTRAASWNLGSLDPFWGGPLR
ncbi:hypothetical protein GQ53DRAFT_96661 [Thozetella sp. PMI_491]|nr:hypothetical protein GQ53DRAFT_96661 [Thozetella sp. PMI_491]